MRRSSLLLFLLPLLATACTSLVGLAYAPSLEDAGAKDAFSNTDGDTELDETSLPPSEDAAPPLDAAPFANSPLPAEASGPADASAPVDSGPAAPPPTGCASGATVLALPMDGSSVTFNTTGPACITYRASVNGWNASNVQGRTVTAMGSTTQMPVIDGDSLGDQPALVPGADGYVYWNFTAGAESYASMSTF
jgi:hypothetical protein